MAGLNGGVVSSIFATSLIFTIIIFSTKWYGQTISKFDIGGTVLIIICIVCVGLGGLIPKDKDTSTDAKVLADDLQTISSTESTPKASIDDD